MDPFIAQWQEESKDGFDDFAKALGLSSQKTEFYKTAKTCISYSLDGDVWTIKVGMVTDQGTMNGREFKFKIGEPYDSANLDGTPMKSQIMTENGKFVETHKMEDIINLMHITREIKEGKMHVTTEYDQHVMTSVYSKV